MKYLMINTAGTQAEFLLHIDGKEVFFRDESGKSSSETLMPGVADALSKLGETLPALNFIGCVTGPGSFTGIRIGVSTARGFCQVAELAALPVRFTQLLAFDQSVRAHQKTVTAVHGWGDNVYAAIYDGEGNELEAARAMKYDELKDLVKNNGATLIVDGAAAAYIDGTVYDAAGCMRRVAEKYADKAGDYRRLVPEYLVKPQAERDLK